MHSRSFQLYSSLSSLSLCRYLWKTFITWRASTIVRGMFRMMASGVSMRLTTSSSYSVMSQSSQMPMRSRAIVTSVKRNWKSWLVSWIQMEWLLVSCWGCSVTVESGVNKVADLWHNYNIVIIPCDLKCSFSLSLSLSPSLPLSLSLHERWM